MSRTADARAEARDEGWPLGARDVVVSLIALVTVALAQPLLDLLGRNAAFLVAHDATGFDVVTLALGLTLVVPLAAAGFVLLIKRFSLPAATAVHAALLAVLGVALVLVVCQLSGASDVLPGWLVVLLAVAGGAGVAYAYQASSGLRRLLVIGVVAAPVVAGLFVFATPAAALVFPQPPAVVADIPHDAPPIVFVMFDELPVASLLTPDGDIDAEAFPNFAALAEDATFFRNITTVHGQTSDAVPAALTGRYPRVDALPLLADHPDNLFAQLSGTYRLHVREALTELCPPGRCRSGVREATAVRYRTLVRDLAVVGSHLVVPDDLAGALPPVDQGWRDFRSAAAEAGKEGAVIERFRALREDDPAPLFEQFVSEVTSGDRPTLHFVHTLLPHSPWSYLPDGRRHTTERYPSGLERGRWTTDSWRVAQGYARHLAQVQLADRLLGKMLAKVKAEGIYDDALVVVMADHGASISPDRSLRVLVPETFGEIGAMPLLLKAPGQRNGEVSDRPLEIVDVLPTILDVIGADPNASADDEPLDGRSAFDRSAPERTSKRFYGATGPLTFPAAGEEKWPIVARKGQLFTARGRAGDPFDFPFNLTPPGFEDLLDQPVPAAPPRAEGLVATIDNAAAYANIDTAAPVLPALLQGRLNGADSTPVIAVAVNGRVAAVTRADLDGGAIRGFRVLLPPETLREGANDIQIFIVSPTGALTEVTSG